MEEMGKELFTQDSEKMTDSITPESSPVFDLVYYLAIIIAVAIIATAFILFYI